MKPQYLVLAAACIFTLQAQAGESCDDTAFSAARKTFKKLYDQKNYAEAVKTLKATLGHCYKKTEQNKEQFCWAESDLALGLLKSGDAQGCRNELAPKVETNPTCDCCNEIEESAAEKAAAHNYDLCVKALDAELSKFTTTNCPLKLPPRTLASTLLPSNASPNKGATECLALVGTEYGKDFYFGNLPDLQKQFDENPQVICNQVVRLIREKTDSNETQSIVPAVQSDDKVLKDSSYCCKLDRLGVINEGGKILLRVSSTIGPSQPCGGYGTARGTADGIYEFNKGQLTLKRDLSWGIH